MSSTRKDEGIPIIYSIFVKVLFFFAKIQLLKILFRNDFDFYFLIEKHVSYVTENTGARSRSSLIVKENNFS